MSKGEMNIYSNGTYTDFFSQGEKFLLASERCLGEKNGDTITIMKPSGNGSIMVQLSAPAVVNASFACELFFKALLLKNNKTFPRGKDGHNLLKLYKLLPDKIREKIVNICFKDISKENFEEILNNHADDFVEIRYFIENKGYTNMSPLMMYTLAFNLHQITKCYFTMEKANEQKHNS